MEIPKTNWLEDFHETCRDIIEDTIFLDALAVYADTDSVFLQSGADGYFPPAFQRLTGYLSQHALELYRLEERLTPEQ